MFKVARGKDVGQYCYVLILPHNPAGADKSEGRGAGGDNGAEEGGWGRYQETE